MAPLLTALQLLTRIPIPSNTSFSEEIARRAQAWFPWVGILTGIAMTSPLLLSDPHLPNLAPFAAVLLPLLLTGALHEDAIADSADALFGGHTPERRIEILKDSRLGTYGASALWFLLGARFLATRELYLNLATKDLITTILFAHVFARTLAALTSHCCTPRSTETPQRTALFTGKLSPFGLLLCITPSAVFLTLATRLAVATLLPLLATIAIARLYLNRIGSLRGDALGCIIAVSETLILARPENLL
jgi:adenosylcobinamide-GDP ribazoletransferase